MSYENQPNTILTVYSPFAWIEEAGDFITFPTAQNTAITFPGSIKINTLSSNDPTSNVNLFQNQTLGHIQLGNSNDFEGGICIGQTQVSPIDYTIVIGNSAFATIIPNIQTSIIGGSVDPILVNSGLQFEAASTVTFNKLEPRIGTKLDIGVLTNEIINIGTKVSRSAAINIGTSTNTVFIPKIDALTAMSIADDSNNAITIGGRASRTQPISIGANMGGGGVINIGSALAITNITNLETSSIADNSNVALTIGTDVGRTQPISIAVNTGASTVNVNIMNGAGVQSGTFSVQTNSLNTGHIVLGNTTGGDISINGKIIQPFRIQYTAQDDSDLYMGAYKTGTYQSSPALSFVTTSGNTNIRIAAHIDGLLAVGVYQVNVVCAGFANKLSPYLSLIGYTKTVLPQWVDGALLTGGTEVASINWTGRHYTTSTSHGFTMNVSGILKVSPKVYFCVGVTNQDNDAMTLTTDTLMTITRIG
jgi:hypothetical protein